MMSPGAALPVNKLVVGTDSRKNNDVIKAFGQLPYELIAQFPNVQCLVPWATRTLPAWEMLPGPALSVPWCIT